MSSGGSYCARSLRSDRAPCAPALAPASATAASGSQPSASSSAAFRKGPTSSVECLGDAGGGDRHHDDDPDVTAPAPDFGVNAGGEDGRAFLLAEAAFKLSPDGSPCPVAPA